MTITPVTEQSLTELLPALSTAAARVRGKERPHPVAALTALRLLGYNEDRVPSPSAAWIILRLAGAAPKRSSDPSRRNTLPVKLASIMALVEHLPAPVAEALLTELLARISEP